MPPGIRAPPLLRHHFVGSSSRPPRPSAQAPVPPLLLGAQTNRLPAPVAPAPCVCWRGVSHTWRATRVPLLCIFSGTQAHTAWRWPSGIFVPFHCTCHHCNTCTGLLPRSAPPPFFLVPYTPAFVHAPPLFFWRERPTPQQCAPPMHARLLCFFPKFLAVPCPLPMRHPVGRPRQPLPA